jgi:hypothetical protein
VQRHERGEAIFSPQPLLSSGFDARTEQIRKNENRKMEFDIQQEQCQNLTVVLYTLILSPNNGP